MNNQTRLTGAFCAFIFCITGAAIGQLRHLPQQNAGNVRRRNTTKTVIALTPELKAKLDKAGRLEDIALAALRAGNYEEAEANARQSFSVDVGSGFSQMVLGEALYSQGKDEEALQVYKQMADAGSDDTRQLARYSLLSLKAGQWAQAAAAYNKALLTFTPYNRGDDAALHSEFGHFSPSVPKPHELETALHIMLGNDYDAHAPEWRFPVGVTGLSEYKKALTLSPHSAAVMLFYGRGFEKMNRTAEAKAAFAKAVQLGDKDVKAAAQKAMR